MKIKNNLFKIGLLSLASIAILGGINFTNNSNSEVTPTYAWSGNQTSNCPTNYYSGTDGKVGTSLLNAIKSVNAPNSKSYDWSRYEKADEAQNDSSSILCIYTRTNKGKSSHVGSSYSWSTWNREHIYTQSAFPNSDTDNHNIFACEGQINNVRGNLKFGDVDNSSSNRVSVHGYTTDCYKAGSYFEPCDEAKGEVARAVMYCAVQYGYSISSIFQSESLCLSWHEQFPVTNRDIYRNNTVYGLQGNRNPFVDHPEWANAIWGDKTLPSSTGIKVDSTMSLTVGVSKNVNAVVTGGTGTVTYTSSNTAVATVNSSGLVTGVKEGTATITASVTISGTTYKATCAVTVTEPVTVSSVTLTGPTSITSGEKGSKTFQVSATVNYSGKTGTNKVTYSSNNTSVATISSTGLVTCLNNGSVTLTATSQEDTTKKGTLTVNISGLTAPSGATVTKSTFSALEGDLDNVAAYKTAQNSGTSIPQLNNSEIRLYQNASGSNGGSITLYVKDSDNYYLTEAIVGTSMGTTVAHKVDGGTQTTDKSLAAGAKYTVSGLTATSVEVICRGTSKSTRLYVNYVSVTYVNKNSGETLVTAIDLANYIMEENIEGQCTTKFYVAKDMYVSLSTEEQNTFLNSTETLISNARERYNAWARHLNENPYSYSTSNNVLLLGNSFKDFYSLIPAIIISAFTLIGVYLTLKIYKKQK